MTCEDEWAKHDHLQTDGDGVFVKKGFKFIISDELSINPPSSTIILSLLNKLGVNDGGIIEETILNLGGDEVIHDCCSAYKLPFLNVQLEFRPVPLTKCLLSFSDFEFTSRYFHLRYPSDGLVLW